MKRNINFFLVSILIAFASCSFTPKSFDDPDKDKLLMQLITYLLEEGHFEPKAINDDFSEGVYTSFLNQVDPFKNYFYQSDIESLKALSAIGVDFISSGALTKHVQAVDLSLRVIEIHSSKI